MDNPRLTRIEAGYLVGNRPRIAGCNACLPVHGIDVREPYARLSFDHIDLDGLDTSAYTLVEGRIHVPNTPGFGIHLDDTIFRKSVESEGFVVS